jgi:hypothetical protein
MKDLSKRNVHTVYDNSYLKFLAYIYGEDNVPQRPHDINMNTIANQFFKRRKLEKRAAQINNSEDDDEETS